MNTELIIQVIMGIVVFVGIPYIADQLDKPTVAAILGAVPVPIFLTFFIVNNKKNNNIINKWSKMQIILPLMGILFGIIFYLLIVKYRINKNITASFIICLWLFIALLAYILT